MKNYTLQDVVKTIRKETGRKRMITSNHYIELKWIYEKSKSKREAVEWSKVALGW